MRNYFIVSIITLVLFSCHEEVEPIVNNEEEMAQEIIYETRDLSSEYNNIVAFDFPEISIYPGSILKLSSLKEGEAIEMSDFSKRKVPLIGDLFIKGISTVTEIIPSYNNFIEFHTSLVEGNRPIDNNFSTFYYNALPIYSNNHFKYIIDDYQGEIFDESLEQIDFDKKDLTSRGVLYARRYNYNYSLSNPEDGMYVEEDLQNDEFEYLDAALIGTVLYGRVDLILYESEHAHYLVHDIVGSAMNGEELSDEEDDILSEIKVICYSIRNEPGVRKFYEGNGDFGILKDFYLGKGEYLEDGDGTIIGFLMRDMKKHISINFDKEVTFEEPVALE
ncbi:hypothetical protein DN752_20030 [Echinicola strongylocentroti]|uniref:Uncharacterized protein n=1 Tax=Echinicola strongylocentroti TaxID=1795355 RepID=A0A2Z4IN28_9BACT|nr:hypothetical protein [Echinicola strongylocentroti]AWW32244.1 hypothetical protein DN752_20030 [Echinicola strongylocentroti]